MAQTLAILNAIAKEIYEGKINDQLNDEVVTLKRIKRSSEGIQDEVGGKYVVFSVHTRRNTGIGARLENEALPPAGQQKYAAGRVSLKYLYGAAELTGQAIRLIDKNYQAFGSAVEEEMTRLKNDLAVDLNRQVYGNGQGGIGGALTAASTASTTVTVTNAFAFDLDMKVDIVTPAGLGTTTPTATKATGLTVTAVDVEANTIEVDSAVTAAIGDIVIRTGNYGREWTGFGAIVSDSGTLYNIDPSVEPVWKAVVDDNGGTGRAVSEGLFNQVTDTVKVNGGKTTVGFTTYGVRRAYVNLLQQQRSYVNTEGKFDGGFTAVAYSTPDGEIPLMVDRMAPKGTVYWINENEIKLYRDADWAFMQYGNGDRWKQKTAGGDDFDAYSSRLFQYSELGTKRRNTHAVIKDLNEA